ncbi:RNA polymerase sigma factor, partial [Halalkalibacterium halodurans]|uniref:RNA polymerase sigma factor n=1 Tax=Halalkalibacterium halodurans TaxID=86665 RepID=UPI002E215BDA|nr:RNA polymerase sigma factor [Halalkalibacterium halodurans]
FLLPNTIYLDQEWLTPERSHENQSIISMDMEQVFDQLKPEQKTLLLLRFYSGYSIPEIAHMLEKPEGTIKSQLHRALTKVKEKLENGGETYGSNGTEY